MNSDLTAQAADAVIEPAGTSQRDDETGSERSGSVAVSDVNVEVASDQDQGSDAAAAQGSETSAPQSQTDGSMNQASTTNDASRNSTQDTHGDSMSEMSDGVAIGDGQGYSLYVPPGAPRYPGDDGQGNGYPDEVENEEDGTPILTNKFLREHFKKFQRGSGYYRTPALNEKLLLHFKGFNRVSNMAQFINLKCLYFEGNGCKTLKGLEENTKLLSLYMQENIIEKIEGLETLTKLRNLNLADNCLKTIDGLSGCKELESLNLKRNRIGAGGGGLDDLKGLLDCPSITSLDLADNNIDDPAIVDEILVKLPNLRVVYCQNNPFVKKVNAYRKTLISKLKDLRYLDDRPVFPEDRRRAEAYARGGIEEERKEMKAIKKEKEDRHWANHEAFKLMIQKAKEEKKEAEARKGTMKEMMAEAKKKKEEAKAGKGDGAEGAEIGEEKKEAPADPSKDIFSDRDLPGGALSEEVKDFAQQLAELAEKRYFEKQNNIPHDGPDPHNNPIQKEMDEEQEAERKKWADKYKEAKTAEEAKNMSNKEMQSLLKEVQKKAPVQKTDDDSKNLEEEVEEDDDCPALEEATAEELENMKKKKQAEWLEGVVNKHTSGAAEYGEKPEHLQNIGSGLNKNMQEAHVTLGAQHKATMEFSGDQTEKPKDQTAEHAMKSMMDDIKMQEALGYKDTEELAANPTTEFDELD